MAHGTEARDAEVEDLHDTAGRQHDVRRLEIAVQHARAVCDGEGVGDLHGDCDGERLGQRPLGEPRGQRLALDEFEDDGDVAVVFDDVVDGGDGGMREGGGGAGFVEQLRAAAGGTGLGARDGLERDVTAQARVFREHDGAHAALPEFTQDPIRADGRADHRGDTSNGGRKRGGHRREVAGVRSRETTQGAWRPRRTTAPSWPCPWRQWPC